MQSGPLDFATERLVMHDGLRRQSAGGSRQFTVSTRINADIDHDQGVNLALK